MQGSDTTLNPYLAFNGNCRDATLTFGDAIIMASDGMPENEVVFGNSVSLSIAALVVKDGERMFNNLSAGGTIVMPWEKTFWGAMFGMCKYKFGIDWMVNVELKYE
jgi:PhnB protein